MSLALNLSSHTMSCPPAHDLPHITLPPDLSISSRLDVDMPISFPPSPTLPCRIVSLSSVAHETADIDMADLHFTGIAYHTPFLCSTLPCPRHSIFLPLLLAAPPTSASTGVVLFSPPFYPTHPSNLAPASNPFPSFDTPPQISCPVAYRLQLHY